jgi:hypothetical protein
MKYFSILLLLCLGCREEVPTKPAWHIIVLIDETGGLSSLPDPENLFSLIALDKKPEQSILIEVRLISDIDQNAGIIFTLPAGDPLNSTPDNRKAKIKSFKRKITEYIHSLDTNAVKGHTVLHRSIVSAISTLVKSNAEHRHLYVTSDLMENDIVSFYDPPTWQKVMNDPTTIEQQLLRDTPLPKSLGGISIIFSFTPRSYEQTVQYRYASKLFKHLYETASVE